MKTKVTAYNTESDFNEIIEMTLKDFANRLPDIHSNCYYQFQKANRLYMQDNSELEKINKSK